MLGRKMKGSKRERVDRLISEGSWKMYFGVKVLMICCIRGKNVS